MKTFLLITALFSATAFGSTAISLGSFTYYCDSVNGSDANSGLSQSVPKRTIASLMTNTVASGRSIGLARGSLWREQLTITNNNVTVAAYGSGVPPILDCSDIVTASWSKTAGKTFVYECTVSLTSPSSTSWVSVWENSNRLVRATSTTTCDSTAGSYFPSADTSTPITLYIHASDDSNPSSNGKVYEHSKRSYGLNADPYSGYTNTTVMGLWTRRNLDNNGSIQLKGQMYNCLASEGTKHNVLIAGGSYLYNVKAQDCYFSPSSTLFVCNDDIGLGQNVTYENCEASCTTSNSNTPNISGWYDHLNVSGGYGTITWINPRANNLGLGMSGGARGFVVAGGYFSNCIVGVELSSTNITVSNVLFSCWYRSLQIDDGVDVMRVTGCAFTGSQSQYHILDINTTASQVNLTNNVFFNSARMIQFNTSPPILSLYSNSFNTVQGFLFIMKSTNQIADDYNFFVSGTTVAADDLNAGAQKTIAQWTTATGNESHTGTTNGTLPTLPTPLAFGTMSDPPKVVITGNVVIQ